MIFPQGEFATAVDDDIAFGVNVDLGYAFPNLPIIVGIEGGYAVYGSETHRIPVSLTVQTVDVEATTTNSIALGHLFARFQPYKGDFRPYFEGLLGLTYFSTSSSMENLSTGEEIAGSTNSDDLANCRLDKFRRYCFQLWRWRRDRREGVRRARC